MTFDMSAGQYARRSPRARILPIPRSRPRRTGCPGSSDGPDDLKDKLPRVRLDFTRELRRRQFKSCSSACAFSDREQGLLRAASMTSLGIITGNLPANLFTSYSVKEFDAPPLLNGDFDEIVDYVYGGMPASTSTIIQSSIWDVDEYVSEALRQGALRRRDGFDAFNGNAGVRFVRTETTSTGFGSVNGGALQPLAYRQRLHRGAAERELHVQPRRRQAAALRRWRASSRVRRSMSCAPRARCGTQTPPLHRQRRQSAARPVPRHPVRRVVRVLLRARSAVRDGVFYKDVDTHIGYTTRSRDHRRRHLRGDRAVQRRRRRHRGRGAHVPDAVRE